jgi:hypothetical protein
MDDPVLEAAVHPGVILAPSEKKALLIESAAINSETTATEVDQNVVDFDENDPENPLNWPTWRKWTIVWCTTTC